ncbi:MAG: type II toxin-antitoxin system Phd/YefM family antitoxin [Nitrospirota bacterium]|nr:type II toxin-antitoxin system Phd/YefM family antitoxin [Nitrospirota bacterium]
MTTMKVSIRKAREKFSEIVNTVAIKGERVILVSKNKPKAAIVSLKDLELLEKPAIKRAKRLAQIERIGRIRNALLQKGVISNSTHILRKMREERIEKFSGLN